ncbi:MAG: hypothetical protein LBS68_01160 [Puniceicoccales bacterium]|nr:hypothetical protein [Puniceicoccales bacterium]
MTVSSPTGGTAGCTGTYASSPRPVIPEQEIISSIQSTTTPRDLRILICAFVRAHKDNFTVYGKPAAPQLESELRTLLGENLQRNGNNVPRSIQGANQEAKINAFIDALKSNADAIDSKCEIDFANDIRYSIPTDIADLLDGIPNQLLGNYFIFDKFFPESPPPPPPQSNIRNFYERVHGFITNNGEVRVDEIGHTMFILANDIKKEQNDDLRLEKKALLGRLKILHGNRDLQMQLCFIKAPIPEAISRLGSFREATAIAGRDLENAELRRIALQAWIYPVRQGPVSSCFATAPLNNAQMNNPARMLILIIEILASGSMERQTKEHAKIKIAVNSYEQPQPNQQPFKGVQDALVRTIADASHLMGYRDLNPSSFSSRSPVENLNKAMTKVNACLSNTEGSYSPFPTIIWTPPAYDFNAQEYCPNNSRANGDHGAWIAHYSIDGNPSVPMTDFSGIDAIHEQLKGLYNACNLKTVRQQITKAIGCITKIRQMYGGAETSSRKRVHVQGGGRANGSMKAMGGDMAIYSPLKNRYTTADGVFRHWFPAMANAAKNKMTRVLVHGIDHIYNLVLDMSQALMNKLNHSDPDAVLNYIKKGNEILFIDSNGEGLRGIGIRYSPDADNYILFAQTDRGTKTDIDPSDENWECLFKDLYAVE